MNKEIARYHGDLVHSRKRVKEQDVMDAVSLMQTTTTCLQKVTQSYLHTCETNKKESSNLNVLKVHWKKKVYGQKEVRNLISRTFNGKKTFCLVRKEVYRKLL